jgi:hypothetical protein
MRLAMPGYAKLSPQLAERLEAIKPSIDRDLHYYPCSVKLKNGEVLPCVYIVWEETYIHYWGVYPEQDRGKNWVRIEDLAAVTESPFRLPAQFANELYRNGESGMGYTRFTVSFSDGSEAAYITGNAVDFIQYPEGKSAADVVKVKPHKAKPDSVLRCPRYFWCLYSKV